MKKNKRRDFYATPLGILQWEQDAGVAGPTEAARKLMIPLRTYWRWRVDGMPEKLQREVILDRMEAALKRHA